MESRLIFCLLKQITGYIFLVSVLFCSAVNAEWIMSAPPRESAGKGEKDYAPNRRISQPNSW